MFDLQKKMIPRHFSYLKISDMSRSRPYAFNSFFYKRRTQNDACFHEGMRRWLWGPGKDVKNLNLILFPVNLSRVHWVLAAIDTRTRQFIYLDSLLSMNSDSERVSNTLQSWLRDEVTEFAGKEYARELNVYERRIIMNPSYLPR